MSIKNPESFDESVIIFKICSRQKRWCKAQDRRKPVRPFLSKLNINSCITLTYSFIQQLLKEHNYSFNCNETISVLQWFLYLNCLAKITFFKYIHWKK